MTLATRTRHEIVTDTRDGIQLTAFYKVQGMDGKTLYVSSWITSEVQADAAVLDSVLEWFDVQAQEAAAHPGAYSTGLWT